MNSGVDEELIMKDLEEFEQLRISLIDDIMMINKRIKHKKDMKVIKKEAMKNMIEGPPINTSIPIEFDSSQNEESKNISPK